MSTQPAALTAPDAAVVPTTPEALRDAAAALTTAARRIGEAMRTFARAVVRSAREAYARVRRIVRAATGDPVLVAGVEARFYVRGGLDPAYVEPEARDAYVRRIIAGDVPDPEVRWMRRRDRCGVAASFLGGWVTTTP